MPTPETQKHTPELDEQSYYDRDLLREQMTTLRKEAAQRTKLEKAIETKFHEESAPTECRHRKKTPGNQRPLYDPDCFTQC